MKSCTKCNVLQDLSNFRECKYPNGKIYYKSICKQCERIIAKEYSANHKEERKIYAREYLQNNPEYIKNWKTDNKEYLRTQERKRRATDTNFKLKKNVSRAIAHAITKGGKSVIKYLPFTMPDLKKHLESLFDDKMSWENYGSYWHIDHIIPHSTFSYASMEDEEFKKCWSLENLRPLEATQNKSDGATRIRHKG